MVSTIHNPQSKTQDNDAPDVLPTAINQLFATLWLLLFAGRWIVAPLSQWFGLVTAAQWEDLDRRVLLPCYAVLLGITLIVLALRFVRGAQVTPSQSSDPMPPATSPK